MLKGTVCVGRVPEVDPVIIELVVLSQDITACVDVYY